MIYNPSISFILLILVTLNMISLYYLKNLELKEYFIDTSLVAATMVIIAVAFYFAQPLVLLGAFIYGFRMTNVDNLLKFIFLYAGLGIGYFTSNNFFTYTSVIFLAIFTIVRMVESIIEMTLWTPDSEILLTKE